MQPNNISRVCVYVDGSNFYHIVLKKLNVKDTEFDYEALIKYLIGNGILGEDGKRYYVGTVQAQNNIPNEAFSRQQALFTYLRSHGWEIKHSPLRKRVEEVVIDNRIDAYEKIKAIGISTLKVERWREKGIDVKLAVDLMVGAIDNKYDTAIIVSSDTDLVPAIDWVRKRGHKTVEYVGFSIPDKYNSENDTKPTNSLIKAANLTKILLSNDIESFIHKKPSISLL